MSSFYLCQLPTDHYVSFKTPFHAEKNTSAKPWVHPFHSLFQVESGEDSGPRRTAPGIPANKDTAATKSGESLWLSMESNFTEAFFLMFFCDLGPVKPSLLSPAGDVVKYSSQLSDHIFPSQDVQGIRIQELYCAIVLCSIKFFCGLYSFSRHHQKVQLATSATRTSPTWQRVNCHKHTHKWWQWQRGMARLITFKRCENWPHPSQQFMLSCECTDD